MRLNINFNLFAHLWFIRPPGKKTFFNVLVPVGFLTLLNPILPSQHHMLCFLNLFSLLH